MKKERNIAFIVELLLLFMILLFVIVVITQTFMKSRSQSLYARHLTEAVTLAEEVAEVSASAEDLTEAAERLGAMEQVLEVRKLQGDQESQKPQELQENLESQETRESQGESEARPDAAAGLVMAMEFAAENGTRDEYRVELDWVEENEGIASAESTSGGDAAVDSVLAGDTESTEAEVDAAGETGAANGGRFVTKQIRVYFAGEQEPIYTLDAGDLKES